MRGAILLSFSVCVAFGQAADPEGPSPYLDQNKVLERLLEKPSRSASRLVKPGTRESAPAQAVTETPGPCAIPLTRIEVKGFASAMPKLRGRPEAMAPMPEVEVPAPSCR